MKYLIFSLPLFLVLAFLSWKEPSFSERIQVPLLKEVDPLTSTSIVWPKTFRFLARGHQVFAFESEDEQFVLKFFDREELEDHWYDHLPFRSSKKRDRRLKERVQVYPESYRLAFEWFRDETALLAVHQGISSVQYPKVTLVDKSGPIEVDLNKTPFILQKKVRSSLPALLEKANREGTLSNLIDQFLEIHRQRISIQIGDYDRNIRDNYGSDGERLIYLDPARLHIDKNLLDPTICLAEWIRVTDPVRKWLKQNAAEEVGLFDIKIEQFLAWQSSKVYKGNHHACRSHCWNYKNCHYSFDCSRM